MIRLALLSFAACTADPLVHVELRYTQSDVPRALSVFAEQGSRVWLDTFGVDGRAYDAGDTTPECAQRWFDASPGDCRIVIALTFTPQSELGGALGTTVRASRDTAIAFELHDFEIESVVAHEVGHTVFDTDEHLLDGEVGIMSARSSWQLTPTDADVAWADAHDGGRR